MTGEHLVDQHLGVLLNEVLDAVYQAKHLVFVVNEVLDAVYQAKQATWSASTSPARADLQELVSFLIDQSGRFVIAEERIDGRSADVTAPSSHQRGNLLAEVARLRAAS